MENRSTPASSSSVAKVCRSAWVLKRRVSPARRLAFWQLFSRTAMPRCRSGMMSTPMYCSEPSAQNCPVSKEDSRCRCSYFTALKIINLTYNGFSRIRPLRFLQENSRRNATLHRAWCHHVGGLESATRRPPHGRIWTNFRKFCWDNRSALANFGRVRSGLRFRVCQHCARAR